MNQSTPPSTANTVAPISLMSWALIFAIPGFWSVNYLVGRTAPAWIAPHALAFSRWALAAALLAVFAWPELKAKRHLIWADRWQFLLLGMLGMWVCGAWLYVAARTSPANNIALIYALSPVFIVFGSSIFLREYLQKRQWLGIALALIGLVHVVIQGRWDSAVQTQFVVGDLWVLACALAWAVYSVLLKKWSSPFSPLARLVLIAAAGALWMLPLAVLEAFSGWPHTQTAWGWDAAVLIAAAAIFPGVGAYGAYSLLQKRIGASRTAMVLYLGPLYAAALAWFVLGEPLRDYHAVGALIILPGIFLASQAKQTATASATPPAVSSA